MCCKLSLKRLMLCCVVCQLLGVEGSVLSEALTHKKIVAKGEEVKCFSSPERI